MPRFQIELDEATAEGLALCALEDLHDVPNRRRGCSPGGQSAARAGGRAPPLGREPAAPWGEGCAMLNQAVFRELESYGLTDEHLLQLLTVCRRGTGKAIWYMDHNGIATVEFTVKASRNRRARYALSDHAPREGYPLMDHPSLDTPEMEAALHAYWLAREQAWRYVLGAVDPSAYDAPALPMLEVLTRVRGLGGTGDDPLYAGARVVRGNGHSGGENG